MTLAWRASPRMGSPTSVNSAPGSRCTALSRKRPRRSLGPCRSWRIATGRPQRASPSRMRWISSACPACVPCEKLSRATSMPAATSWSSASREALDGPSVQTMRVRRASRSGRVSAGGLGDSAGRPPVTGVSWFERNADERRRPLRGAGGPADGAPVTAGSARGAGAGRPASPRRVRVCWAWIRRAASSSPLRIASTTARRVWESRRSRARPVARRLPVFTARLRSRTPS